MIPKHYRFCLRLLSLGGAGATLMLWGTHPCGAQINYPTQTFTFDTSVLSKYTGPFTLDFQLTDGSGTSDANTSLKADNFQIDGAPASGISSVSLQDTTFFSEELRTFTPGSMLAFDLSGMYGVDTDMSETITPDEFSFTILQGNGREVSTTSPVGGLLIVDFDNPTPASVTTLQYQLVHSAAVPEPGVFGLLMGTAVFGTGLLARRRNRH